MLCAGDFWGGGNLFRAARDIRLMSAQEWGPWIDHDGSHPDPCAKGQWIHCIFADKTEYVGPALEGPAWMGDLPHGFTPGDPEYFGVMVSDSWVWGHGGCMVPVIKYRLAKNPSVEVMKIKAKALDCVSPKNLENVER